LASFQRNGTRNKKQGASLWNINAIYQGKYVEIIPSGKRLLKSLSKKKKRKRKTILKRFLRN
jgi:hypothetical protein